MADADKVKKEIQELLAGLARRHKDWGKVDGKIKKQSCEMCDHTERRLEQYRKIMDKLKGDFPEALGEEYDEELDASRRSAQARGMFST